MKFLTLAAVAALTIGSVSQSFASASPENSCQMKALARARQIAPTDAIVTDIMQTERAVIISSSSPSLVNDANPAGNVDITLYVSPSCELTGSQISVYGN